MNEHLDEEYLGIADHSTCRSCRHYDGWLCQYPLPWWVKKDLKSGARDVEIDQAQDCEMFIRK